MFIRSVANWRQLLYLELYPILVHSDDPHALGQRIMVRGFGLTGTPWPDHGQKS